MGDDLYSLGCRLIDGRLYYGKITKDIRTREEIGFS